MLDDLSVVNFAIDEVDRLLAGSARLDRRLSAKIVAHVLLAVSEPKGPVWRSMTSELVALATLEGVSEEK